MIVGCLVGPFQISVVILVAEEDLVSGIQAIYSGRNPIASSGSLVGKS